MKDEKRSSSPIVENAPEAFPDPKRSDSGKAAGSSKGKPSGKGKDGKGISKKQANLILIIIMIVALFGCLAYIGTVVYNNIAAKNAYGAVDEIAKGSKGRMIDTDGDGIADTEMLEGEKVVDSGSSYSPIDIAALQSVNKDVYAWIRIPGTYVDYPIAQSDIEDNYYLHRSIYRSYLFAGMIYTQSCNKKDFSDPITVIYGHNMRSTTMFSSLHYFADAPFFKEHEYFYIYTADRVLTYRIISVYKYDNRHIMNSFDFSNGKVLYNYQQFMLNPTSTVKNVRSGVSLNDESKVVVLSTCMTNDKSSRLLVNGVMVSDVPIQKDR